MQQAVGAQNTVSVFILFILFSTVIADCYFPNGTNSNIGLSSELYQACGGGDKHSMCCRMGRDQCRDDGLCSNYQRNEIWRESCTDPTWRSPSCVKLCVTGTGTLSKRDLEVRIDWI